MSHDKSTILPFYIGNSPTLGIRGILASKNIRSGTTIHKCPLLLVPMEQDEFLQKTVVHKYYFEWTAQYTAIALGYGSLFNHSYTPNAKYIQDYRNKLLVFKTIKDIAQEEEITINYNFFPDCQDPLDPGLVDFNKHFDTNE